MYFSSYAFERFFHRPLDVRLKQLPSPSKGLLPHVIGVQEELDVRRSHRLWKDKWTVAEPGTDGYNIQTRARLRNPMVLRIGDFPMDCVAQVPQDIQDVLEVFS